MSKFFLIKAIVLVLFLFMSDVAMADRVYFDNNTHLSGCKVKKDVQTGEYIRAICENNSIWKNEEYFIKKKYERLHNKLELAKSSFMNQIKKNQNKIDSSKLSQDEHGSIEDFDLAHKKLDKECERELCRLDNNHIVEIKPDLFAFKVKNLIISILANATAIETSQNY